MSWFSDNEIDAQPDQVQPQAPAGVTPGYNYQQFQAGWLNAPAKTNLQDFINAHPEYATGATVSKGGEYLNLPGGQSFDAVQAIGELDKPMWGDQMHDYATGRQYTPAESIAEEQRWAQEHGVAWDGSGGGRGPTIQAGGGGGGGGLGSIGGSSSSTSQPGINVALPTAPTYTPFAPTSTVPGDFTPTNTFGEATPFSYSGPQAQTLTAQQLTAPDRATYNNFDLPPGFVAPTAEEAANDPGYQFRLQQGQQALEQSAAAKGLLHTGGTLKGLQDYGQNAASQEYANVYGRRLGEAQTAYNQGFQTNQANNAGNLAVQQANAQQGLAYGQANNQNTLAFGQANNAAQAQNYGQAANTYGMNQQGQAQQYGQQANTYAQNLAAQNQGYTQGFNTNQANNAGALNNYQAQVNAALGQGNLALGYQNSNNSYALGQGNLGIQQGQLGIQQGQLGLQSAGQAFNQGLALNQNAWNQNYQLASLGNPGAANPQGFGQQQGNLYTDQGNANAAGQVGSANAWNAGLGQIGNAGMQGYAAWLASQQPRTA